jgi:hypothetical protein
MAIVSTFAPEDDDGRNRRAQIVGMFGRAKYLLVAGNLDYAIELLMDCCKGDPANFDFRQELRKVEKRKYNDNKKGRPFTFLWTWRTSILLARARAGKKHLQVVDLAEEIFRHNPWHARASIAQARAFEQLGLGRLAAWTLEQARSATDRPAKAL